MIDVSSTKQKLQKIQNIQIYLQAIFLYIPKLCIYLVDYNFQQNLKYIHPSFEILHFILNTL